MTFAESVDELRMDLREAIRPVLKAHKDQIGCNPSRINVVMVETTTRHERIRQFELARVDLEFTP